MSDSIGNKYEVMEAASRKLHAVVSVIGLDGKDFQSDAALEDAVPQPAEGQAIVDPLDAMHMAIAAQIRGPYRDALGTVDEFVKAASDKAEEIAVNVRKSADEYLAREERAIRDFNRIMGELGEEPP
ncbi:hypothetical protein MOQ72_40780 [Saccharopolyspora sp. K220]|uniref:hypothetical protein n=1 Tax=Saccharopolyspora soli TaxID=2926618 RepID=UPI001F5A9265|nr:hypothetical protein [Saccharopolyspora soli]MCI2423761.1 hypothetical protein [Saccharopolyspora soli]